MGSERFQHVLNPFWTPEVYTGPANSAVSMQKIIDHLRKLGLKPRRIGVEFPFLPADAAMLLQQSFPDAEIVDSLVVLERLRARRDRGAGLELTPQLYIARQDALGFGARGKQAPGPADFIRE